MALNRFLCREGPALEARQDGQDDERKDGGQDRGGLATEAGGNANRRSQPDTGGGRESLDVPLAAVVQDRPRARKPMPVTNPWITRDTSADVPPDC